MTGTVSQSQLIEARNGCASCQWDFLTLSCMSNDKSIIFWNRTRNVNITFLGKWNRAPVAQTHVWGIFRAEKCVNNATNTPGWRTWSPFSLWGHGSEHKVGILFYVSEEPRSIQELDNAVRIDGAPSTHTLVLARGKHSPRRTDVVSYIQQIVRDSSESPKELVGCPQPHWSAPEAGKVHKKIKASDREQRKNREIWNRWLYYTFTYGYPNLYSTCCNFKLGFQAMRYENIKYREDPSCFLHLFVD